MNVLWNTFSFIAEEQSVSSSEGCIPKGSIRMGRKKINVLGPVFGTDEAWPIRVLNQIQGFPVVHSGTPKVIVRYFETQWVNQVEATIGKGTDSTNASSVLGYFRAIKDNLDHRFNEFFIACSASR
jgi:hypothetical protein